MGFVGLDVVAARGVAADLGRWSVDIERVIAEILEAEALCELPTLTVGRLDEIGATGRALAVGLERAANEVEGFAISVEPPPVVLAGVEMPGEGGVSKRPGDGHPHHPLPSPGLFPVSKVVSYTGISQGEYTRAVRGLVASGLSVDEARAQLDVRLASLLIADRFGFTGIDVVAAGGLISGEVAVDGNHGLDPELARALANVEVLWTAAGHPIVRLGGAANRELIRNGLTTGVIQTLPVGERAVGDAINLDATGDEMAFLVWPAQVVAGVAKAGYETVVTAPQWVPALAQGTADLLAASVPFTEWREAEAEAFVTAIFDGLVAQGQAALAGDPDAVGAILFEIIAAKGAGRLSAAGAARARSILVEFLDAPPSPPLAGAPRSGAVANSNFAQNNVVPGSKKFSDEGEGLYTELAGYPVVTVDDLADALRAQDVTPSGIPVDYVVLDGHQLILNTRTSTALRKAGIPQAEWFGRNVTGMDVPELPNTTFDDLARAQLARNGLPPTGSPTLGIDQ